MDRQEFERLKVYEKAIRLLKEAPLDISYQEAEEQVKTLACIDEEQYSEILSLVVPIEDQVFHASFIRKRSGDDGILFRREVFRDKTTEDFENLRRKVIDELCADKLLDSIYKISTEGADFREIVEDIANQRVIKAVFHAGFSTDICIRMIKDGVALSKIAEYLNEDFLDLYKFAMERKLPISLSEEEKKMVEEAEKERKRQFPFGRSDN